MDLTHHSDDALLKLLGERLAQHRLNRNLKQSDLADEAGIARMTVSRAENGQGTDLASFLRILRALDLLEGLDQLVPAAGISPVALAKMQGRQRQRARGEPSTPDADTPWTWPE